MQIKFVAVAACAAILTACATNAATSLFKDFKVNGQTVSAAYQQGLYDDQLTAGQKDSPELRNAVKSLAIEHFVVRDAAFKSGVADDPAVNRKIEAARIRILEQAIAADYLKKNPITESQVQAAYKRAQTEYGTTEYHVKQIFVDNEKDATALKAKLDKRPNDFSALAKSENDSEPLAQRSGDMGWVSASVFKDPAVKDVVLKAKPGSKAQLVKSQAGWHLIRVEGIRPTQLFPDYEKAKASIATQLAQQKAKAYLINLVKGAKVE